MANYDVAERIAEGLKEIGVEVSDLETKMVLETRKVNFLDLPLDWLGIAIEWMEEGLETIHPQLREHLEAHPAMQDVVTDPQKKISYIHCEWIETILLFCGKTRKPAGDWWLDLLYNKIVTVEMWGPGGDQSHSVAQVTGILKGGDHHGYWHVIVNDQIMLTWPTWVDYEITPGDCEFPVSDVKLKFNQEEEE